MKTPANLPQSGGWRTSKQFERYLSYCFIR
jgi:hypothetical protein